GVPTLMRDTLCDSCLRDVADLLSLPTRRSSDLKTVLTEEEYTAARQSTLTAFYTPPTIISAMYQALENMGLKSGNILEPSCGTGDRKSTRLNSSHVSISYAVFCLKKTTDAANHL